MISPPEKETITCMKCGYEFLYYSNDPCPKCGHKLKARAIGIDSKPLRVSGEVITQKEQTNERKIVNWPLKIILIIILVGSPLLGLFLANIPGAIVGLLIDIVAWYLEKFAEQRFIEKTIERDHYH